jgi:hypothetical protein
MRIDIKHTISSLLRRVALAMTLAAATSMASAGTIHVAIDTSSFGVSSGYLDMQLSASSGVPLATALVSNMIGFAAIDLNYGVTPQAGGFQFRNDVSNYLSHAATFGGLLSFDLTFDGEPDPLTTYVSHFVIAAFDEAFAPLGAYDPVSGALADISWTPSVTPGVEGSIGFIVSDPAVTVVPEPSDWLLTGIGLGAMALVLRRRTTPAAAQNRAGSGFAIGFAA